MDNKKMDDERIEEFRRSNTHQCAGMNYSDEHVHVLMTLSDAKKKDGISVIEHHLDVANSRAFWSYFDNIQLYTDEAAPYLSAEYHQQLKAFCRENCNGNLQTAINYIDKIIRQLIENNIDYVSDDILPLLRMNTDFLRDVLTIINRDKAQQHRKNDKRVSMQSEFSLEDIENKPLSGLSSGRVAAALINTGIAQQSIERHLTHIPTNNPSAGHPYFNAYCLVCHRPSAKQNKYCTLHKTDTNKRKTAQNIFNRAFNNLGYTLLHESSIADRLKSSYLNTSYHELSDRELFESHYRQAITDAEAEMGLTREDLLDKKSLFLFGWARKHPIHINFKGQLADEFDRQAATNEQPATELVKLNNTFFRLAPMHPHFKKRQRQPLLSLKESPEDLLASVKSNLGIHTNDPISAAQLTPSILRLSCYQLIKMASSSKRDKATVDYDCNFSRHISEFI